MPSPYDAYLEDKVLSASPLELLQMLYQGAIGSIRRARKCIREGDVMGRSRAITHAQAIVMELTASIDASPSSGLALRLTELYAYVQQRLTDAHIQQSERPLAEAEQLLEVLLGAWRECSLKLEGGELAVDAEAVPAYSRRQIA